MPYTSNDPNHRPSVEHLRENIVGWGLDLARNARPAVPKEKFDLEATGAHWDFPERQLERYPREHSIEHRMLTPVFGTACPPRGFSGLMRRYAYRFSEARTLRWGVLLLADRVDVAESRVMAFVRRRPDKPVLETGLRAELDRHGWSSRVHRGRADVLHQLLDAARFVGPKRLPGSAIGLLDLLDLVRPRRRAQAPRPDA